jgi:putative polyhydroxyalkanoate system protein
MKKPVVVTVPHRHTRLEAQKRMREGLEKLTPQLGGLVTALENDWHGDELRFRWMVMKQEVTGRVHVMDSSARIEVDLPWILATIAEKLRGQIEKKATQLLIEKK